MARWHTCPEHQRPMDCIRPWGRTYALICRGCSDALGLDQVSERYWRRFFDEVMRTPPLADDAPARLPTKPDNPEVIAAFQALTDLFGEKRRGAA